MEDVYINSPDNSVYNILSFSVLGVKRDNASFARKKRDICQQRLGLLKGQNKLGARRFRNEQ